MAKAKGIISLLGTISDITFYKINENYFAVRKNHFIKGILGEEDEGVKPRRKLNLPGF